jgi:succinate dehydrogenase / fumarate reductase cytochrome b subunit
MADTPKMKMHERPLSPHLQVWRSHITMVMSIVHRITGCALYFGTLLLAWWLIAAATNAQYFDYVNDVMSSILGRLVLFGYTWALLHHMAGGVRHLFWDMIVGLEIGSANKWAWGTLVFSGVGTILLWVVAYCVA